MANYKNRIKSKEKNLDVVNEVSDAIKIKELPIILPDGTPVKVGMTVYSVMSHEVSSYAYGKDSILSHSGRVSSSLKLSTVIAVNQAAVSRTFTIRSDRGCEETYTVRNNCLPNIYGKKLTALAEMAERHDKDIEKCEAKAKKFQDVADKWTKTASTLKKAKLG